MITYDRPTDVGTTGQSQRTMLVYGENGQIEAQFNGWKSRSGGNASAEITIVEGDEYQGSYAVGGNNKTYDDLTATTFFDPERITEAIEYLESRLGFKCEFIEHRTKNGQPVKGKPWRRVGKLKAVKGPDAEDRKSTNPTEVEITMAVSA